MNACEWTVKAQMAGFMQFVPAEAWAYLQQPDTGPKLPSPEERYKMLYQWLATRPGKHGTAEVAKGVGWKISLVRESLHKAPGVLHFKSGKKHLWAVQ